MPTITVGEAPKLVSALQDETTKSPRSVTLCCRIRKGEPPATVRWYHGTREIYAGDKYSMTYDDDKACLEVSPTAAADGGKYKCEAANRMGRVETEAKLTVQCE